MVDESAKPRVTAADHEAMARLGRAEREVPKFGSRPPRTLEQVHAEVSQMRRMLPNGESGYDAQADLRGHRALRARLLERSPKPTAPGPRSHAR